MPNQTISKSALPWLGLSLLVIVLDQLSKYLVNTHLGYAEPVTLLPFLNITLRYNSGAAYSFLSNAGGWQIYFFTAISCLIVIIMLIWLKKTARQAYWLGAGIALVIGGAIGNLIDRVRLTFVIDFIDFHIKAWHFATFNIADSAISVGVVMIILALLFSRDNKPA